MIIDGKQIAKDVELNIKEVIETNDICLGLAIILIGDDEASHIYVNNKLKMAQRIGINCEVIKFEEDVSDFELISQIEALNEDNAINGVIVQLPIPKHLDENKILSLISPQKDVDGFNPLSKFMPATAIGVVKILETVIDDFAGLNAVVIGRSKIVGKPVAELLLSKNCTVTQCHRHTKDLSLYTKNADIVVVATGVPNLLTKDMVKQDCIIVDVGINRVDGKLCGDSDFVNLKDYVKAITPVPGGVGPMTVACLMDNVLNGV
ncbi:MAG: bifunctional 5,10-methylenetetrahydrofolate dehydrogenase/5,10-methenyltetrahydrofolate cyclohydrolase [Alphaproteobacteria bacterium]